MFTKTFVFRNPLPMVPGDISTGFLIDSCWCTRLETWDKKATHCRCTGAHHNAHQTHDWWFVWLSGAARASGIGEGRTNLNLMRLDCNLIVDDRGWSIPVLHASQSEWLRQHAEGAKQSLRKMEVEIISNVIYNFWFFNPYKCDVVLSKNQFT